MCIRRSLFRPAILSELSCNTFLNLSIQCLWVLSRVTQYCSVFFAVAVHHSTRKQHVTWFIWQPFSSFPLARNDGGFSAIIDSLKRCQYVQIVQLPYQPANKQQKRKEGLPYDMPRGSVDLTSLRTSAINARASGMLK